MRALRRSPRPRLLRSRVRLGGCNRRRTPARDARRRSGRRHLRAARRDASAFVAVATALLGETRAWGARAGLRRVRQSRLLSDAMPRAVLPPAAAQPEASGWAARRTPRVAEQRGFPVSGGPFASHAGNCRRRARSVGGVSRALGAAHLHLVGRVLHTDDRPGITWADGPVRQTMGGTDEPQ